MSKKMRRQTNEVQTHTPTGGGMEREKVESKRQVVLSEGESDDTSVDTACMTRSHNFPR